MNDLNMNRLPVPTWNQCGVNSAPKAAALPAVPADDWGEVNLAFTLPAGVGEAEEDFTTFAESGMGAETDAFLLGNANVRSALTVAEGVEVNDPVQFEVTLDAAHPTALSLFSLARRWNAVAVEEGPGAKVEQVRVELGGSLSACGTRAMLGTPKSEYDLDAVYFGGEDAVLDYNDVSVHTAKDTLCEMHTAGVLTGNADKILRGTIDFRRGAKRGVGHESEDVLLFSPHARNRTAPLILCGEEEVEGQHAASIGRLDEAKLYYLRSRGLNEAQARRLMVDARFAPAIEKIPLEALREEVRAEAARRLDETC